MKKKDYMLIAGVIRRVRAEFLSPERIDYLSMELAVALHDNDPKFQDLKFLKACGTQD